ncbi:hypothetical protein EBT16_10590 [bacterium]|nr:hypothetical protein [bacterium]
MIKKFHEYYVPVLKFLKESGPTHQTKLKEALAKIENLTLDEINQTSEKGTNIFSSRIHWALQYLYQSGTHCFKNHDLPQFLGETGVPEVGRI